MQFWPTNDEHMCLKHVEAWNKLILKQKFCAPSWLITEKNNSLTVLNYNFSKEKYKLPEDDRVIEICRSILNVLI